MVVLLVLGAVVGSQPSGLRSAAGSTADRHGAADTLPRVPRVSSSLVGLLRGADGFAALAQRLRLWGADAPPPAAALAAPTEAAAPPTALAPPPPRPEVAIAPPPRSAFGGTDDPSAPVVAAHAAPTRYGDVTPTGGTWALLIGVNDYPGARYDLRSAVNDVNDVDEALARLGVTSDRRMLLRDQQATAGFIRTGLDWLTAHAGPDATMVVFYAGHVQKLSARTEALVGADGGVVADSEIAEVLDRSSARTWIGIAACYAAGFDELVRPNRILTAAAGADSLAYENEAFGRSYLVEYMVRRAMLGAGLTTVEAAFDRAAAQLRQDYPNRVPVEVDQFDGDLDLRVRSGSPAPAPAPSPAPPPSSPPPGGPDGCADLTAGVVRCQR